MIVKVKKICYEGMPEIELPREIDFPDEEDLHHNWEIVYELVKAWKKDLEMLKILKKRPDLLCCFAHDGVFTWDDYNETYSDEDKQYIGATKEEFEKIKEWLDE